MKSIKESILSSSSAGFRNIVQDIITVCNKAKIKGDTLDMSEYKFEIENSDYSIHIYELNKFYYETLIISGEDMKNKYAGVKIHFNSCTCMYVADLKNTNIGSFTFDVLNCTFPFSGYRVLYDSELANIYKNSNLHSIVLGSSYDQRQYISSKMILEINKLFTAPELKNVTIKITDLVSTNISKTSISWIKKIKNAKINRLCLYSKIVIYSVHAEGGQICRNSNDSNEFAVVIKNDSTIESNTIKNIKEFIINNPNTELYIENSKIILKNDKLFSVS